MEAGMTTMYPTLRFRAIVPAYSPTFKPLLEAQKVVWWHFIPDILKRLEVDMNLARSTDVDHDGKSTAYNIVHGGKVYASERAREKRNTLRRSGTSGSWETSWKNSNDTGTIKGSFTDFIEEIWQPRMDEVAGEFSEVDKGDIERIRKIGVLLEPFRPERSPELEKSDEWLDSVVSESAIFDCSRRKS
ncbi:hypothetical protein CC78DRAFT_578062 [Lojkania enalia]|uniref:Uncharacterized protein n=1 Tax=Lojkania enalia TaxID=147567 RepID=A0A9P4KDN1_9PLEO|nr:hypothetical protein CC78DRAFT_578062 [Didymosphaeria enalia]